MNCEVVGGSAASNACTSQSCLYGKTTNKKCMTVHVLSTTVLPQCSLVTWEALMASSVITGAFVLKSSAKGSANSHCYSIIAGPGSKQIIGREKRGRMGDDASRGTTVFD